MKKLIMLTIVLFAGYANAAHFPETFFGCPNDLRVHMNEQGEVWFNTKKVHVEKYNGNYLEASKDGVTVSLTRDGGRDFSASYSGKRGGNGVCQQISEYDYKHGESADRYSMNSNDYSRHHDHSNDYSRRDGRDDRTARACARKVAAVTGADEDRISVSDVSSSQAATIYMMSVPDADASWKCFVDRRGHVSDVEFGGAQG